MTIFWSGCFLASEFVEFGQLCVLLRLPVAREFEDGKKPFGVLPQMFGEVFDEDIGAQPIKIRGGARSLSVW